MFKIILLFISVFLSTFLSPENEALPPDGVYFIEKNGATKKALNSRVHIGYYATNILRGFWHSPKRYFTDKPVINELKSFKKIQLIGSEFDARTMKEIMLLEMEEVKLGMTVIHKTNGQKWDDGIIVKQAESNHSDLSGIMLKHSKSQFLKEIGVSEELVKNKLYCFWINKTYYLFRIV